MTAPTYPGAGIPASLTIPTYGTLVMKRHYPTTNEHDEPAYLTVEHADPHILVSDELMHTLAIHDCIRTLGVQLTPPTDDEQWTSSIPWITRHYHDFDADPWPCKPEPSAPCYAHWLLRITARNATHVYRIHTYNQQHNAWEATWPD